jgi:hypothetical protein
MIPHYGKDGNFGKSIFPIFLLGARPKPNMKAQLLCIHKFYFEDTCANFCRTQAFLPFVSTFLTPTGFLWVPIPIDSIDGKRHRSDLIQDLDLVVAVPSRA